MSESKGFCQSVRSFYPKKSMYCLEAQFFFSTESADAENNDCYRCSKINVGCYFMFAKHSTNVCRRF